MKDKMLFMLYNGEIKYLVNNGMDHREWFISLGGRQEEYDNLIRGFIMDGKIVFFKGPEFKYDNEVIEAAKRYAPGMRIVLGNNTLTVCCGILPGKPGEKWEPIMLLNDSELTGLVVEEKKEMPKPQEPYVYNEEPLIQIMNNYNDDEFLKVASKFTIIVLILTAVFKIILILREKMYLSSFSDILLIILQIGSLLGVLFGYKKKKEYAKFLAIFSSIMIVLSFDLLDVILGILYFLFSIDQGYIKNMIMVANKTANKGKEIYKDKIANKLKK